MRHRWITGIAAITLAAGSLAACGGSGNSATQKGGGVASPPAGDAVLSPAAAVNAAYTRTSAASTMQVAIDGSMNINGVRMPISGTGAVAPKSHLLTMKLTMGAIGTIEMRMLGTTFYEKLPSTGKLASSPYAGKWIKVTLPASVQSANSLDPRQALSYLKGLSSDGIHNAGTAVVRGVQTTHYTAQLDLTKVMEKAQQQLGSSTNLDLTQLAKRMGMQQLPMDIYIDGQHMVRRVSMTMQLTAPSSAGSASGQHVSFAMTEDFYGYGTPVTVAQPPAGDVIDGSGLLKGAPLPGVGTGGTTGD